MARKKTRAQKMRVKHTYHLPSLPASEREERPTARVALKTAGESHDVFAYDVSLFWRDLLRTLVVCLFILSIEVGLWWMWR